MYYSDRHLANSFKYVASCDHEIHVYVANLSNVIVIYLSSSSCWWKLGASHAFLVSGATTCYQFHCLKEPWLETMVYNWQEGCGNSLHVGSLDL